MMNQIAKQLTLFFVLALSTSIVIAGQPSQPLPLIEVTGKGKVTAQPDQAELVLRFSETQFKLEDARELIDAQVSALVKTLTKFDIAESSLDSSQVSIQPRYEYLPNNQRNFVGYQVTRTVNFKLSQLDQLDALVKRISTQQVTGLDMIRFQHSDPESLNREALTLAIENSKSLAQQIADSYEREIDQVHRVSYQTETPNHHPQLMMARESSVDSRGSNYQQKDLVFEARVHASFLMK